MLRWAPFAMVAVLSGMTTACGSDSGSSIATTASDEWCESVQFVSSASFDADPRAAATVVLSALTTMERLRGDEVDVRRFVDHERQTLADLAAVDYDVSKWPPGPSPTVGAGSTVDPIIDIERAILGSCGTAG